MVAQAPMVAIPTQQVETSFTFTQPATTSVAHTQPLVTIPNQIQKSPGYCVTCTLAGEKYPTTYSMPLNPDWSYPEEETDFKKQNKEEDEIKDCDSNLQKQKELEKQELKNGNIKFSLSSPNSMPQPTSDTDDTGRFTPAVSLLTL